jgi:hypothetical protein
MKSSKNILGNCEQSEYFTHNEGGVGFGCFFYGVDFATGGSYTSRNEHMGDTYGVCNLQITPAPEEYRIYGKVQGKVEGVRGLNSVPISNARVAIAKIEPRMIEKLSVSKPAFFDKTATSDDEKAEYEFTFTDPGKPPRALVVSLLWYEGKPEFAVTNGNETAGNHIPVYQALCVDDDDKTECLKWKRMPDGNYEAEVDFEYGNQQKLLDIMTFMDLEDWVGTGGSARIQMNSGYIYYNSYRAMKYLENLGLQIQQQPVMIKSHWIGTKHAGTKAGISCALGSDNAFYDPNTPYPTFGDLGALLDPVSASGAAVYCCDVTSSTSYPDAPLNREWHELGHYLLYEMHAPLPSSPQLSGGAAHKGYDNPHTNDSYIEGFASFFALLTNEYHGDPNPHLYRVGHSVKDIELNFKAWGPGTDEENALNGVLWDFHDPGREVGVGFMLNGRLSQISKVYPNPGDTVSLDAKTILQVLDRSEAKTAVDIYNAFVGLRISQVDLDMIFVDHGFFADVEDRNFIHDSTAETIPQSGSKSAPDRPVRHRPVPRLPGAYLESSADAAINVTVSYAEPFEYSGYSYRLDIKAGEPAYFEMPPRYYPSKATLMLITEEADQASIAMEIDSEEFWNYIDSEPRADGVFKRVDLTESGFPWGRFLALLAVLIGFTIWFAKHRGRKRSAA